jgi:hypothetical protein
VYAVDNHAPLERKYRIFRISMKFPLLYSPARNGSAKGVAYFLVNEADVIERQQPMALQINGKRPLVVLQG